MTPKRQQPPTLDEDGPTPEPTPIDSILEIEYRTIEFANQASRIVLRIAREGKDRTDHASWDAYCEADHAKEMAMAGWRHARRARIAGDLDQATAEMEYAGAGLILARLAEVTIPRRRD